MQAGFEVKAQGDGFMLAFASARDAVRCESGSRVALAERDPKAHELRVRIGLHTGEPVREPTTSTASRSCSRLASPPRRGARRSSSPHWCATSPGIGRVRFDAPTDTELKGLSGMHRLSAVRWRI
jgi:hypothetical protein